MRKVRFAYQIRITQLCLGIVQFILVILLGIVLVTSPYIFSPYSPRFYISHDAHVVNAVKELVSHKDQVGRNVLIFKELNVTFGYKDKSYYGQVMYCQRHDIIGEQEKVEVQVETCASKMEFDDNVNAYQVKGEKLYPHKNLLYLKSDFFKQYEFEVVFAGLLALVYVVFTILFEVCSIFYIEFRWRKYFTLVKSNQTPRPKTFRSDETREPFVVQKANYDRFGRMTMKRGCLICPKLEEGESIPQKYELEGGVGRKTFRPKSGFWSVLAASSRHKKEIMIQKIKVPFKKVVMSTRGLRSVLVPPFAMIMVIVVMLGLLFAFIYFQGPVMALSAICVITSIICLYIIALIFEFCGGVIQLLTEEVVLTNSRIVFCWLERFNHKIEYLYYDDIESFELDDNSKLIRVQVTDSLVNRLKDITSERNLNDLPLSFFQYLEHLERDEVARILEKIKEAKFAYKHYESDIEGGQDEDEEVLEEEGMGREEELQTIEENTIKLDLIADDDEEEEENGDEGEKQEVGLLKDQE